MFPPGVALPTSIPVPVLQTKNVTLFRHVLQLNFFSTVSTNYTEFKDAIHNITVKYGDGHNGWVEYAPFDAIIVTAAPNKVPKILINQLKVGGRLVLPVGNINQQLKVITKTENDKNEQRNIISVRFVPMVHSNPANPDSCHKNN